MSEILKPCPFCGSEAGIPINLDGTPVDYEVTICCCKNDDCLMADYWTPIEIWQSRPIEDELRNSIAELKEVNKGLEDICEILRKENKRLFSKVFSNAYRKECAE